MSTNRNGGRYCAGINCKNNHFKNPDKTFFSFPADLDRCKMWVNNCRRADLDKRDIKNVSRKMLLCEDHFEASQFMNPKEKGVCKKYKRLLPNALPTIFAVPNPPTPLTIKRKLPIRRELCGKKRKVEYLTVTPDIFLPCCLPTTACGSPAPSSSDAISSSNTSSPPGS